jgi:hypothetical protein
MDGGRARRPAGQKRAEDQALADAQPGDIGRDGPPRGRHRAESALTQVDLGADVVVGREGADHQVGHRLTLAAQPIFSMTSSDTL